MGGSQVEIWPESDEMPENTMLQIVVEDADQMANNARKSGIEVHGPTDAHGERIYFALAPSGLPITFQSKLK